LYSDKLLEYVLFSTVVGARDGPLRRKPRRSRVRSRWCH